jgi:alpha-L-rhamnosidase
VAPRPGGGLRNCSTRLVTPYGTAAVTWERIDGRLEATVEVPVGSTALIALPGPDEGPVTAPRRVGPGIHTISTPFRRPQDDPPRPPHITKIAAAVRAASRLREGTTT